MPGQRVQFKVGPPANEKAVAGKGEKERESERMIMTFQKRYNLITI